MPREDRDRETDGSGIIRRLSDYISEAKDVVIVLGMVLAVLAYVMKAKAGIDDLPAIKATIANHEMRIAASEMKLDFLVEGMSSLTGKQFQGRKR